MIDPLDDLWFRLREAAPIITAGEPGLLSGITFDRLSVEHAQVVVAVQAAALIAECATHPAMTPEWRERIADALHETSLHIWPDAAASTLEEDR
jgi:hypothetical protein